MTHYEIVPATEEDALKMAPHLREIDTRECWLQAGMKPKEVLVSAIEQSDVAYAAYLKGNDIPCCIFGIGQSQIWDPDTATIWLLGTDELDTIRKTFVRQSFNMVELMGAGKKLYNYVHQDNKKSLRWLKALGFTIMDAEPYGWQDKPFHYIEKEVPQCVPQQSQ